ncbi:MULTISPECIES: hypothetical protein [Acetobacter]|uniref:Uncharacterized protein n=1 Tax=Acetobacter tropicalis TaxID=104102 RepID=A0A291PGA1_9PROT|nr:MULTISPECIES: hypothetical protein [Acetobacter]ATJ90404.1 hypothetical protein CIW82_06620 [Acetobacter tropicalis]
MGEYISRAELAQRMGRSERTLRRYLPTIPGLSCIRIGRRIYFTEQDIALIEEALRCPYPTAREESAGTLVARSALVVKSSRSRSSTRDALLVRMRKQLEQKKKPQSESENYKDRRQP